MLNKKKLIESIGMTDDEQKQFLQEIYNQKTPSTQAPLTDVEIEELKLKEFKPEVNS